MGKDSVEEVIGEGEGEFRDDLEMLEEKDEEALGRKKIYKKWMLTWHPMWQDGGAMGLSRPGGKATCVSDVERQCPRQESGVHVSHISPE